MKRFLLCVVVLVAMIVGGLEPREASAHDTSCATARAIMGHPNAYCRHSSPLHVWLYFPWRTCEEHVWSWHLPPYYVVHQFDHGPHCPWGTPT